MKFSKQEQTGLPIIMRQTEFGPHGDGTQLGGGSVWSSSGIIATNKKRFRLINLKKREDQRQLEIGLRIRVHWVNGSPVKPGVQVQIGLWLLTWQTDPMPHVFGHGSAHLLLIHALFGAHSDETTHSGRQAGLQLKMKQKTKNWVKK